MYSVFNMLPDNKHGGSDVGFFFFFFFLQSNGSSALLTQRDMASNTPFPEFKTTGDDKHDLKTYIEDLTDYWIMQNWLDPSEETDPL